MWVTPLVLDFGKLGVGETSPQLAVTIKNVGNAALENWAGGGVNPPFGGGQTCAPSVAPGGSCQFIYTFSPSEVGTFTTTSNVNTNAGNFSIELRGEGVGAGLHVNPLSLDFGQLATGNSTQQVVTVRNTGLSTLTDFAGGGVNPPFSGGQNCASGVPPGGSCQYTFTFSPTTAGMFTDTSNSSTNAGSFSIDLMGRGLGGLVGPYQKVTPRSLDFGPVGVNLSGGTLTVNITNQSVTYITGWAGGGVNAPFSAGQNCAPSLGPGETCQFYYSFDPTETGVFTTTSNVSTSLDTFSIQLRGEGVGAELSVNPLVLDFGYTDYGVQQVVTILNTGMATMENFAGGGVNPPFSASQNCAPTLNPGETCQFFYEYNPIVFDRHITTSTVSTNGGTFSIRLMGGMEVPLVEQTFEPSQISLGGTSTLQYTISNPNPGATFFSLFFDNLFPEGMIVDSPLLYSVSPECGEPTFSPSAGDPDALFWGATVLAGDECVIYLNVTADEIGTYTNSINVGAEYSGYSIINTATLSVGGIVYLPLVVR
jgi:hypothetical protein